MREFVLLAAMVAGSPVWADPLQPFVDFELLYSNHAAEMTVDTSQTIGPVRFLDLGDGLRFSCRGLAGWACGGNDYNHDRMDIGCALTALSGLLHLAGRHAGFAKDKDQAALTAMFDEAVVYLAANALPPRERAAVQAAAVRSAGGFATAEADAMDLGDRDEIGAIILRQALKEATSPKYRAAFDLATGTARLPVTDCGDELGPVGLP